MREYRTKKEMIYDIMKNEIYEGHYEPGEKLIISRLAKRFQCSEIPVREAINQLESDHLIIFKPHIGAFVAPLSLKDIQNIFELRVTIEALATRLASTHLTKKDFEELKTILDKSKIALKEKDDEQLEELNLQFHMKIYTRADNELLVRMIQDLWKNSNRYGSIFKQNEEHNKRSVHEHEEIYNALLQADGSKAETMMIAHKEHVRQEVLKLTQREFQEVEDIIK